jgi:hypothetical protein
MRKGGKMLGLRPALLSAKPLSQLVLEARTEADKLQFMARVFLWLGAGMLLTSVCRRMGEDAGPRGAR